MTLEVAEICLFISQAARLTTFVTGIQFSSKKKLLLYDLCQFMQKVKWLF